MNKMADKMNTRCREKVGVDSWHLSTFNLFWRRKRQNNTHWWFRV